MPTRVIFADEVRVGDMIRSEMFPVDTFTGRPRPFLRVVRIRDDGPYWQTDVDGYRTNQTHVLSFILEDLEGNQSAYGYNVVTPVQVESADQQEEEVIP